MIRSADELFQVYLKHGDPVLLGRTYDLVSPGLLTLALHVRPDPDLAEDLVHDVFLKAIEQAHEWNGETPFTAWMVSLLAAEIEVSKGTPQLPGSLVDLEEGQLLPEERGPLAQAQVSELNLQLDQAIEKLPERYQGVVRMGIREGLDSMTIGETLKRSPGTVRSQLARGLDRLRQLLPSALSLGLLCGLDRSSMTSHAFGSQTLKRRILDSADLVPAGAPVATVASAWLKALGVGTLAAGLAVLTYFAASGEETSPVLASAGEPDLEFTGQSSAREAALFLPNAQERRTGDHRDPTSTGLRSQIVGRVMDKDGQPIVGAKARLLDRRAQSELDHPVIYQEVQTDDLGFYNLSLATKDAEGLELGIQHSDNMSAVHFPFGNPDHGTTPIWPGTNDLGTTTLFPAACVRGRIL
ncbi:MAG: sigma-70 family RNA polymerase sigma factor, partial [Planctomycetota bacterium]|nr:sigma-70 family RNA polymerase sigma factor [Planctomycetota bacterium]